MNYVKLNGVSFDVDVAISEYSETFNVLDGKNAGRVIAKGRMIRDIIGTYVGHSITFFNKGGECGDSAFDELWDFLVKNSVKDSIMLEAVDGQNQISYEAYYTTGTRMLRNVSNGVNHWDALTVNFVPMEAQYLP